MKFSAIVVTCNEEKYLKSSLDSLRFCDQIIVVDLGSVDSSVKIAKEAGAEVLTHERVPVVEKVREFGMRKAKNDWVVFQDPDEVLPVELAAQAVEVVEKSSDIAILRVPWKFYFKEKPLDYSFWGFATKNKVLLVHRERVKLRPLVHRGFEVVEGYRDMELPWDGRNFVRHYWMSSYRQLFEKHLRYIRQEGESRFKAGQRFSWKSLFSESTDALTESLIDYRGIHGGFTGIFLSFFYSWYVLMSWLSLRRYERAAADKL